MCPILKTSFPKVQIHTQQTNNEKELFLTQYVRLKYP